MATQDKLEIADWQESPSPPIPTKPARYFWPPALIGVLGTLLLHALIIQSVRLGSRGHQIVRSQTQQSSAQPSETAEDAKDLVLITLTPSTGTGRDTLQNVVSSTLVLSKIAFASAIVPDAPPTLNVDSLTLGDEDEASHPVIASGNGGERARLVGIYTGQIEARIDRIWRRPRTAVNESDTTESFQCEAQIVQDNAGYVEEILLPRCNGSGAWQHSLVTAIRQASPLPAPPDISVFSRSITLSFIGLPYFEGANSDEYETPLVQLAQTEQNK